MCLPRRRPGFHPWVRQIPCGRKWLPTPVFLPGEAHGQRSLAGYGPWGRTQLSDSALSISESLCYTPDTNTTLKHNSTPIKTEKECSCRFLGVECKLLGWKKQKMTLDNVNRKTVH